MICGISGTKQTVRNREVSVRRGWTVTVYNVYWFVFMLSNNPQNLKPACTCYLLEDTSQYFFSPPPPLSPFHLQQC